MTAACAARGVRFVLVLQPERDVTPPYRRFRKLAMKRLRAAHVETIDGGRLQGLEARHFLDDVHLTSDGNRQLATEVAARIPAEWTGPPP